MEWEEKQGFKKKQQTKKTIWNVKLLFFSISIILKVWMMCVGLKRNAKLKLNQVTCIVWSRGRDSVETEMFTGAGCLPLVLWLRQVFTLQDLHTMWRHGRSLGSALELSFVSQTAHTSAFSTETQDTCSGLFWPLPPSLPSLIISVTEKQTNKHSLTSPSHRVFLTTPLSRSPASVSVLLAKLNHLLQPLQSSITTG